MSAPFAIGGCHCGTVRYALDARPVTAEFRHCRMCHRATGPVAAGFLDVDRAVPMGGHRGVQSEVRWLRLDDGSPRRKTGEGVSAAPLWADLEQGDA